MKNLLIVIPFVASLISCSNTSDVIASKIRTNYLQYLIHPVHGEVFFNNEHYQASRNLCEYKTYNKDIVIDGSKISSRKELMDVYSGYFSQTGSDAITVITREYTTKYKVNQDYFKPEKEKERRQELEKNKPKYIVEIDILNRNYEKCMAVEQKWTRGDFIKINIDTGDIIERLDSHKI